METQMQYRASFLELYISLSRALAVRKGELYPALKKQHTFARKAHGEALSELLASWAEYGKRYATDIENKDGSHFDDGLKESNCTRDLCFHQLFTDESFSAKSRNNLWQYIRGLTHHAISYDKEMHLIDVSEEKDGDLPPPSVGEASPFGDGTSPESMNLLKDLANTLPKSVTQKMQTLTQNYSDGLKEGKISQEDINMPSVIRDVFQTLETEELVDVVSNMSNVLEQMQKAQAMPEFMAMMKSMQRR